MYIPKINLETDRNQAVAFMQRFSFATIVTAKDNLPVATHLPFVISMENDEVILKAHFAKANEQWKDIEGNKVLVIFSEPHAYISPTNYDKEQNVPTWNYVSVHAYGKGKLIAETTQALDVLEATIQNYEAAYLQQWSHLPSDYKLKMLNGIVAFEVAVTDLQAKKKLSQNRNDGEKQKIIETLMNSSDHNERLIADYMQTNQVADK